MDRRDFIKITGISVVALATRPSGNLFAVVELPAEKLPLGQESPLTAGRWAMVVDLRKCLREQGCTKCMDACHLVHNVPKIDNPRNEIKWIWKEPFEHAFLEQEHEYISEELKHAQLPVLCNHCDNPPCVRVCPTQATWKRKKDGIVMMDWHRCIGCRYCIVACPYGSRSFNWYDPRKFLDMENLKSDFPTRTKGVVEKCTFCEERLSSGQLPACCEACTEKALIFGDLDDPDSELRELLRSNYSIVRKSGLGTRPQVYYIV